MRVSLALFLMKVSLAHYDYKPGMKKLITQCTAATGHLNHLKVPHHRWNHHNRNPHISLLFLHNWDLLNFACFSFFLLKSPFWLQSLKRVGPPTHTMGDYPLVWSPLPSPSLQHHAGLMGDGNMLPNAGFTFLSLWCPPPPLPRHDQISFLPLSQLLINPVSFEILKLSMGIIQIPEVWNGREAVGKTLINLRWIASPHLILMDSSHPRNLISYTGYP